MKKLKLHLPCNLARLIFAFCLTTAILSPAQTFTTLASFDGANGSDPRASLIQATDGNFYGTASAAGPNSYGTAFKTTAAGTITVLHGFGLTDGAAPQGALVQASDGNFYGVTTEGANCCGTIFRITPGGEFTTVYVFCSELNCADGEDPYDGLIQGTNGNFYGTTSGGGTNYDGTVFEITPAGKLRTLYNFCSQFTCADGDIPWAGLVQGSNGAFYGTTFSGGSDNDGTVFKITASGKLTTLHSFSRTDGAYPTTRVIQATNGDFYGTTQRYGANNGGTFFKISPSGQLTTLYNFCSEADCADGGSPWALVQATDGNFYGATYDGGTTNYGTLFEITPAGKLTTLYSFCPAPPSCAGETPYAGLLQATDGNFYGTTFDGGAANEGSVFRLSTGLGPFVETQPGVGKVGTKVVVLGTDLTGATSVRFNGTNAAFTVVSASEITAAVPSGATTGSLTVRTPSSGTLKSNLVFKVTPQIKSFAPTSGPSGTEVVITGVSLTQTTKVTIGGKVASFTVNSDTQVTATVPTGAKTGKITTTTPGGTATSATSFTVT